MSSAAGELEVDRYYVKEAVKNMLGVGVRGRDVHEDLGP